MTVIMVWGKDFRSIRPKNLLQFRVVLEWNTWGSCGEPVGILWGTGGEPGLFFGEPGFGGCLAPQVFVHFRGQNSRPTVSIYKTKEVMQEIGRGHSAVDPSVAA